MLGATGFWCILCCRCIGKQSPPRTVSLKVLVRDSPPDTWGMLFVFIELALVNCELVCMAELKPGKETLKTDPYELTDSVHLQVCVHWTFHTTRDFSIVVLFGFAL